MRKKGEESRRREKLLKVQLGYSVFWPRFEPESPSHALLHGATVSAFTAGHVTATVCRGDIPVPASDELSQAATPYIIDCEMYIKVLPKQKALDPRK